MNTILMEFRNSNRREDVLFYRRFIKDLVVLLEQLHDKKPSQELALIITNFYDEINTFKTLI